MSLDVYLSQMHETNVYEANITHNLNKMASEAGIYKCLWRPEEVGITKAEQLIPLLKEGLSKLMDNPEYYRRFNSPNGWGTYEDFVPWVRRYLDACREFPNAKVEIWR